MTTFQKAIIKRLDMFLKMFSNYLVIKTIESSVVKTLTDICIHAAIKFPGSWGRDHRTEMKNVHILPTLIKIFRSYFILVHQRHTNQIILLEN